MADDPYSRLYWRLSDEYPDVWDDAATLGAYVQLLAQADMAWPSKPHRPTLIDDDAYAALVECGLVIEYGKRYTIRGLEKERRKRSRHARRAASARYQQDDEQEASTALSNLASTALSNLASTAQTMPSRDETRREETRRDETRQAARATKSRGKGRLLHVGDMLGGQNA